MTRVGVIGSGDVGKVLAKGFKKHGYEVEIGSREGTKLAEWSAAEGIAEGTFASVAARADVVVLAVGGGVALDVVTAVGASLAGKVVIDATNPIGGPPVNGILTFFTGPNDSLMERLQKAVPAARFVKAFSCVGNAWMVSPDFGGQRPTMFICGDDEGAKKKTGEILAQFGWEVEDMGPATAARAIEPLAMLWCIPGIAKGRWTHAFKLLKK